jgi:L-lactate dehydrogenase (cytochrome)
MSLGGSKIILKYAGKDATCVMVLSLPFIILSLLIRQEYEPIHPPDAITTNLPPEKQ